MPNFLSDNDKFKRDLVKQIEGKMPDIETKVLDEVFRVLDSINSAGGRFDVATLNNEQFLNFVNAIRRGLTSGGYQKQVEVLIADYGKITINSSNLLKNIGGFDVPPLQLSQVEQKWKQVTAESLLNSGIRTDFETPILRILDESISYGGSIERAKKNLTEFIKGNTDKSGKLQSYTTQIARDSIGQLQGQQFHSVASAVDTAGVRYIGSLLEDSRGQCTRWVKDLNGFIAWDELSKEIKLAYDNQAAKKVDNYGGKAHPWGGMMPNTTKDNFMAKRGGFNCRHTAIPVKVKPK
jgi:hypothetical protein